MPTINKNYINVKQVKYKSESREKTSDFYNSLSWRRLRDTFISTHPLCQCCLEHDRVVPATDVHHKVPFNRGETDIEKWNLFLKESNLMAVCEKCHLALHFKDKTYHLGFLDSLTDTEYRYAHGLNYNK